MKKVIGMLLSVIGNMIVFSFTDARFIPCVALTLVFGGGALFGMGMNG